MLNIIKKAINRFYIKKDYIAFKKLCEQSLPLFRELKECLDSPKLILSEGGDLNDYPSRSWYINFSNYKKNEFEIEYKTILKISKVTPIFNIQHEFDVPHKNKDSISPSLGYFCDQPYTKEQAELHNEIVSALRQKGYFELKKSDMDEVVEGFKMPEGVTIFGEDITVALLLFVDVLDICSEPIPKL
jgi:hypothetical protein